MLLLLMKDVAFAHLPTEEMQEKPAEKPAEICGNMPVYCTEECRKNRRKFARRSAGKTGGNMPVYSWLDKINGDQAALCYDTCLEGRKHLGMIPILVYQQIQSKTTENCHVPCA